jgi:hypothetical protein
MALYEVTDASLRKISPTSFGAEGLRERGDLQRLLRGQIEIVSPDTLVISEEFGEWEDSRCRIDLLALDKQANLVVIELKRTEDGGHMELQAIRYAAMVSKMTFAKAVDVYAAHMGRLGNSGDARAGILEFLEWSEPREEGFAQDVRLVLVSQEFGKELTSAVLWLNEYGLDIRCVRLTPYSDQGRVLVDVQQVIPLPEAEAYEVKLREKEERERTARKGLTPFQVKMKAFWATLLAEAQARTDLHVGISPSTATWVGRAAGLRGGVYLNYAIGRTHPRVELYISTGNAARNKEIFDRIHSEKKNIEERFGGALGWERLDDKKDCRIRAELPVRTDIEDDATWPQLRRSMIDVMIRFEGALRPVLDVMKQGGVGSK